MTKMVMIPKKKVFIKKHHPLPPKKFAKNFIPIFLGQYHCKADGPSISEHTDIQPLHPKLLEK